MNILNLQTDEFARKLDDAVIDSRTLAFSPSGAMVACGGRDGVVRMIETEQWRLERYWSGHKGSIKALKFIADGRVLCSVGNDGVKLWDASSGKLKRSYPVTGDILTMDVSPSGHSVAIGGRFPNTLRIVDLNTGRQKSLTRPLPDMIEAIAYSPDGKMIVFSSGKRVKAVTVPDE